MEQQHGHFCYCAACSDFKEKLQKERSRRYDWILAAIILVSLLLSVLSGRSDDNCHVVDEPPHSYTVCE